MTHDATRLNVPLKQGEKHGSSYRERIRSGGEEHAGGWALRESAAREGARENEDQEKASDSKNYRKPIAHEVIRSAVSDFWGSLAYLFTQREMNKVYDRKLVPWFSEKFLEEKIEPNYHNPSLKDDLVQFVGLGLIANMAFSQVLRHGIFEMGVGKDEFWGPFVGFLGKTFYGHVKDDEKQYEAGLRMFEFMSLMSGGYVVLPIQAGYEAFTTGYNPRDYGSFNEAAGAFGEIMFKQGLPKWLVTRHMSLAVPFIIENILQSTVGEKREDIETGAADSFMRFWGIGQPPVEQSRRLVRSAPEESEADRPENQQASQPFPHELTADQRAELEDITQALQERTASSLTLHYLNEPEAVRQEALPGQEILPGFFSRYHAGNWQDAAAHSSFAEGSPRLN